MRPHERPPRIWSIVLASVIGVAILVTLGVWQVQRLHWKEGLLAQLAANASAPPAGLADVEERAATGGSVEFMRVKFRGTYRHDAWKKMISTYDGGQGWTIITPAVSADGDAVIVDRGRIPGQRLESFDRPEGEVDILGVIRTYPNGQAYFDPANDPKANLWYWWDEPGMLRESNLPGGLKPFPFVVQLLPESVIADFPRPPEPKANLANNHLGYAITWFGLALTLVGVAGFYIREVKKATKG
ncbi:SURF1 family protein [Aestuariivirga sp.]|uniref:SURF1 family protein n=1 Tax=Aestuariivirga sp. TaxID=2650926 RepID=UPI0035937AA5